MVSNGGKASSLDPALFLWHKNDKLIGIIAVHVDDFLWSGTQWFEANIIAKLRETFLIGNEDSKNFKYLGLNLAHSDNGNIEVFQNKYVNSIEPIQIHPERKKNAGLEINETEKKELSAKIGQLLWACNQTRPDINYEVCSLASQQKCGTVKNLISANKAIRKLKGQKSHLTFQRLSGNCKLVAYTDAAFGNL